MANTKSVAKRARQSERRHEQNKGVKTRVKTFRRKVTEALAAGNKKEAEEGFKELASAVDMAAKNGVVHKNRASKVKSEMGRRVAAAS
jgi:small subunit ribosomal protein S20